MRPNRVTYKGQGWILIQFKELYFIFNVKYHNLHDILIFLGYETKY